MHDIDPPLTRRQLVYVTGSGHSGSTLLDMLLDGLPGVMALGEAHRLSLSARASGRVHLCNCGQPIKSCPFWSAVQAEVAKRLSLPQGPELLEELITTEPSYSRLQADADSTLLGHVYTPRAFKPDLNKLLLILGSRWLHEWVARRNAAVARQLRITRNSLAIYEAARAVSGAPVIVDSTKNASRLKAFILHSPEPVKVIYLVRDGRAVCCSRMKRQQLGMFRSARLWLAEHVRIWLALAIVPERELLMVQYEKLCSEPEAQLSRIAAFLGVPFDRAALNFRDQIHHSLGGNPMRFRGGESAISLDEKWRSDLSRSDQLRFSATAGFLNRLLGYG